MTIGELLSMLVYQFLLPFLFTIFFITFMWGAFTYVITGGPDEEEKERGKALLMYALLGFLFMILIWSVANVIRGIV